MPAEKNSTTLQISILRKAKGKFWKWFHGLGHQVSIYFTLSLGRSYVRLMYCFVHFIIFFSIRNAND